MILFLAMFLIVAIFASTKALFLFTVVGGGGYLGYRKITTRKEKSLL